ncbi:uncharacterized protein LOC131593391 [Vicia villosa]|uniref:uncharacterized protein LOC131593391 n=1 Tax=Vicia villosa TaxID=3911 RepID=UPI00273B33F8|nr:uncharacterized protein LOC131593391 [Vicia villosa]
MHRSEWGEFSNFIDRCGLIDVPCKGKKFSWFSEDGKTKNRLDRFLVDGNIISSWGVVGQLIGKRDVPDHCPMWLVVDKEDWGPKPFKFDNEWFNNKEFLHFVEFEWKAIIVRGRGDFILKEKFRIIKDKLRWWNITVFGKFDLEVEEGVRELNEADDCDVLDDEIQAIKKNASSRFWLNLRIKENMLIQKSRLKWLNDGDFGCLTLCLRRIVLLLSYPSPRRKLRRWCGVVMVRKVRDRMDFLFFLSRSVGIL